MSWVFIKAAYRRFSFVTHGLDVSEFLHGYAKESALPVADSLREDDFLKRLIHSAASEFGLIVDMILCGIEECLVTGGGELGINHFAEAFRKKTACLPACVQSLHRKGFPSD